MSTEQVSSFKAEDAYAVERQTAVLLASAIRTAIEDFHVRHLSDAAMAELNPIIRDTLFTCLVAIRESVANKNSGAAAYLRVTHLLEESYWEPPVLREDFGPTGPWAKLGSE